LIRPPILPEIRQRLKGSDVAPSEIIVRHAPTPREFWTGLGRALGSPTEKRFSRIMAAGAASPRAEQAAVSSAVQYYEQRAARAVCVRDGAVAGLSARTRLLVAFCS
jgi:hypothetical protein